MPLLHKFIKFDGYQLLEVISITLIQSDFLLKFEEITALFTKLRHSTLFFNNLILGLVI